MQSQAKDVQTYIEQAPTDRREALLKLRELCLKVLKGYEESMVYGGPCYARKGTARERVEVGFASQKNYISFYILRQEALDAYRAELTGLSVGKGCIRYSKLGKIDFVIVRKLLMATHKSKGPIC